MGLDYYSENKLCFGWRDLNIDMFNGSILDWYSMFESTGFIDISTHQVCAQKDWPFLAINEQKS